MKDKESSKMAEAKEMPMEEILLKSDEYNKKIDKIEDESLKITDKVNSLADQLEELTASM